MSFGHFMAVKFGLLVCESMYPNLNCPKGKEDGTGVQIVSTDLSRSRLH